MTSNLRHTLVFPVTLSVDGASLISNLAISNCHSLRVAGTGYNCNDDIYLSVRIFTVTMQQQQSLQMFLPTGIVELKSHNRPST